MSVTRLTTPTRPSAVRLPAASEIYNLGRKPESGIERVRRLQTEARILAREQVEALCRDILALAERAAEIAEGGDAFPVGVREMASRLSDDLPDRAQGMRIIAERMAGR